MSTTNHINNDNPNHNSLSQQLNLVVEKQPNLIVEGQSLIALEVATQLASLTRAIQTFIKQFDIIVPTCGNIY